MNYKLKMKLGITLIGLFCCNILLGQIKIGDNPQNIDASSVLELESNSRVLVITRITEAEMNALSPLQGALVYNTDADCVHFYDGNAWLNLCEALGLSLTADAIVNQDPTIIITQNGDNYNFEVGEIRGQNIVDFSIGGVDIQNNSITEDKLAPDSVGSEELRDNTVADSEIDYNQVTLSDFTNDAGYITGTAIVSGAPNNAITDNGGAFYDDTALLNDIAANTAAIAADNDPDPLNEIQTLNLNGNDLSISGGNTIDLSAFTGTGTDDQTLSLNGNQITIEDGNTIDLTPILGGGSTELADQITIVGDGTVGNEFEVNDGSINSTKITDGTITSLDLANNSVTPPKIEPGNADQILRTNAAGTGVVWVDLPAGGAQDLNQVLTQGNSAGNLQIEDLTDPNDPQDAATKAYVDAVAGGGSVEQADQITITGVGTVGDPFKIEPAPLNNQMLITDGAGIIDWIPIVVDTDEQDLAQVLAEGADANATIITNLADPVAAQDAATKAYVDANAGGITGAPGSVFFADGTGVPTENNAQFFWDNTNFFLGVGTNTPMNKLDVDGAIRSQGILNSEGTVAEPGYRFSTNGDTDTGMFRNAEDELGFAAGGIEGLRIDENAGQVNTISFGSLELEAELIDFNGDVGTAGQILSSTGTGTDWIDAPTAGTVNVDGVTIDGDGAGTPLFVPNGGINTAQIAADAVTTAEIADGNVTEIKINPSATDGQVLTTVAGATQWATPTAGAVQTTATIDGDGQVGTPLDLADDAVTTPKIADGNVTEIKINPSATDGQVLTTVAGATQWATPTAGAVQTTATIDGDGQVGTPLDLADDAVTTPKIADGNVTEIKINPSATDGQVLTTVAGATQWTDLPPSSLTGTPNSIWYAAADGSPTEDNDSFFWDPTKRVGSGALGIGIDAGTMGDNSKVHIMEQVLGGIAYPLQIQNRSLENTLGTSVGILFAVEVATYGKGALVYERKDFFGKGDFHFLQRTSNDTAIPDINDAVFSVTNGGNVGVGNTNPQSTLVTEGSFATATLTANGAVNLDDTHHTVLFNGNGSITLPAANTVPGRIYIIKNPSFTVGSNSYNDSFGTPQTTIPAGVVWLQSVNGNWEQVN